MTAQVEKAKTRLDGVFRQTRATVLSEYAYHPVRFFSIFFALVVGLGVLAYLAPIRAQFDKAVNSDNTTQTKIVETTNIDSQFLSVAEVAARSSQPNEYFKGNYEVVSTEDAIKVEKPNIEPSNTEVKVVKEVGTEDRTKDVSVSGTNDALTIESKDQGLTAGAYKVEMVQKDTGKIISDQKVLWGVLAFNPDYAVYPVGKDAFFSLAVLDDRGKMVCTAAMTVEVTDPNGKITTLNTAYGTVRVNKDCEVYGKTDKPDYEANYQPSVEGDYRVKIVAKAGEGTRTLHDQFSVKANQDFYLQRVGVTRTYPPVDYDYTLNFEAKKAGQYTLTEKVPSSFEIKNTKGDVKTDGDSSTSIVWRFDAEAGQTYPLTYAFKTPNISPFLFTLGPASVETSAGKPAEVKPVASGPSTTLGVNQLPEPAPWLEPRSWLIASDNACQSNGTGGGNWSAAASWQTCGGTIPQAADTVTILASDTITEDSASVTVVDLTINSTGTLTISTTNAITVSGNWSNSGTFTANTGTVTFTATDTGNTIQGTLSGSTGKFYNLIFNGAAGEWTPNAAVEVANDITMKAGSLLGTQNITVNGNVACVTTCGTINLTGGTFEQRVGAAKNFGTSVTGTTAWTFYDLTFSNSHASSPFTITTSTAATGGITVSDILKVGKSGDAAGATTTLNAGNRTWTLSGTTGDPFQLLASPLGALTGSTSKMYYTGNNAGGNTTIQSTSGSYYDLEVNAGETFVLEADTVVTNNLTITHASAVLDVTAAPYALTIGNNYSNSGTFTARTGTVTFNATDSGNTLGGTMTGTSSFYNLIFNGVNGAWSFGAAATTVSNDFTITNGTVTAPSTTLTIVGKFDNSGTFTHNSGTVKLTNATTTSKNLKSNASSFNNLEINNGLEAYWKLDEGTGISLADSSGNSQTGTTSGTPTWSSSVKDNNYYGGTGSDPYGVSFSGSTQYAYSATTMPVTGDATFTISGWYYFRSGTAHGVMGWGDTGVALNAAGLWFGLRGTNVISAEFAGNSTAFVNSNISLNTWHQITYVKTPGNIKTTSKFYVDGTDLGAMDATSSTTSPAITNQALHIGRWANYADYVDASMDDMRVYSRAVTANEVTDLYNGRHPGSGVTSTEGTYTLIDALTVAGNLNVRTGMLDVSASNFAVGVAGNYLNVANLNSRAGTFTLNGTATGKTLWSDPTFYNLTTNGSGGGWTQSNRIATTNNFDITNGTYDLNTTYNFALTVAGNFTGNSGTWTLNERASTITVSGNWDTSAIAADSVNIAEGTSTVVMNGTGTKTIKTGATSGWEPRFYNLNVGQAGGKTTQLLTNATSVKNVTTVGAGTFDLNGQTIYIGYSGSSANPLVLDASATVGTGTGYLQFIGSANAIVPAHTYNTNIYARNNTYATTQGGDITVINLLVGCCETPTWTTSNYALNVTGSVTFAGTTPTFNAGSSAITIGANWTTTATTVFNAGTSTFTFNATATGKTITSNGDSFYNVIFNGVGGGWTFQDAMVATNDFTVTNGAVTANNLALTVTRDFTLANTAGVAYTAGSSTITASRHWTDSGAKFVPGTSTVVLNGTGAINATPSFYNISIGYSTKTTTITTNWLVVSNILTLNGGIVTNSGSVRIVIQPIVTSTPIVFASPTTITSIEWMIEIQTAGITTTLPGGDYGTGNWLVLSYRKNTASSTGTFALSGNITMTHGIYMGSQFASTTMTVNTNNFNITAKEISVGACISYSCTLPTTVNLGSSTVTLTGNSTSYGFGVANDGGSHTINMGSSQVSTMGNLYFAKGTGRITATPGTSTLTMNGTSTGRTMAFNGQHLYNLVFNGVSGAWTYNDAALVDNDFTVTNGAVTANNLALTVTRDFTLANTAGVAYTPGSSTVTVSRHWTDSGAKFVYGTSTVVMNGTGTQTGANSYYNFSIGYSGFVTTISNNVLMIFGVMTVNGGTVTASGSYYSLKTSITNTPFVFASPTTLNGSLAALSFENSVGSIITTVAGGNYGNWPLYLQQAGTAATGTFQLGGNLSSTSSITIDAAAVSTGVIFDTTASNYGISSSQIIFGYTSTGRISPVAANFNGSAITLTSGLKVDSDGGAHTLTMGSSVVTTAGDVLFSNGTGTITVTPGTSTLTWTHTSGSKTYAPNGQSLYNMTLNGSGGTVTPSAAVIVTNDLTMTAGTLSGTQNVTVNGAVAGTAGIMSLTGGTFEQRVGAAKNFGTTSGSTAWTFYDLTFSNSHASSPFTVTTQTGGSGGITVSDVLKVGKSGDAVGAITTLNAGNRIWTLSGTAGDPFQLLASPLGALVGGTSKFYYTGANAGGNTTIQSMTSSYYDLELNAADTFVLEGDTVVTNNLTITHVSAILDVTAAPYALTIGGSYSNSGTFTARTGTVTLNGAATQTLSGGMLTTNAFYNLTITNSSGTSPSDNERTGWVAGIDFNAAATVTNNYVITTANVRVEYNSGSTYTIANINWNGAAIGTRIYFRNSAITGTWLLNVSGTQTAVSYVNVSRSDASSGSAIVASDGTNFNAQNNTNWTFSGTVTGTVYGTDETTPVATGPTVRMYINGSTTETTTANGSGVFTFTTGTNANDVLSIYLKTVGGIGITGMTVTKATGSGLSGINIYQSRLTTRCDNTCSLTNANIDNWDKGNDSDIHATVTTSNLVVDNDWKLKVTANTFAPGGTITTSPAGGSSYQGQVGIDASAVLDMAGNALSIGGNYSNSGTFTSGSNTTTFTDTATGNTLAGTMTGASSFYNLVFDGVAGGWTYSNAVAATNDFTVTNGAVTANNLALTVTRDFTLANTAGVAYTAGSSTITVSRHWTDSGAKFVYGTSTVKLIGTGTMSSTVSAFYKLETGYTSYTTTFPANLATFNSLTFNGGTVTGSTSNVTVACSVTCGSSVTINSPTTFTGTGDNRITYRSDVNGITMTIAGGNFGAWGIHGIPTSNIINTTYQLGADITGAAYIDIGAAGTATGTIFNTQNYNITAVQFTVGWSSRTVATTINLGSSTLTLSATGDAFIINSNAGTHTLNLGSSTINTTGNVKFLNGTGSFNVTAGTSTLNWTNTSGTATYAPNGQSLYNLTVNGSGGTLQPTAAVIVTNNFTITAGTYDTVSGSNWGLTIGGNYSNSGTFTARSGTVTFNATDTGNTLGVTMTSTSSFYDLVFNGSGGEWTPSAAVAATNDLTMTAGTLLGTQNITVNGAVAGTAGIINLTGGTFTQSVAAAKNFGTTSGSAAWKFSSLTFSVSSSSFTVTTQTGGTGDITISSVLTIGASTTLSAGNRTWILSGSGTPFVRTGTLTPSTSTFRYTGPADTNITAANYNNLELINSPSVETLVVAGGGGGAAMTGGGGGAGGLAYDEAFGVSAQAYPITVGDGGPGQVGAANPGWGSDGENSVFDTLTAIGGGRGGTNASTYGGGGGSGGSCGHITCTGGSGTGGQGNAGGSQNTTSPHYGGGGGGGAGEAGYPGTSAEGGGNGGDGLSYSITGSPVYYAGGGGGGSYPADGTLGTGGLGGGGNAPAGNGTINTGGGGAGQYNNLANGGNGGSGIVVISYATDGSDGVSASSTGGTITTSGGNTIHTFTADGTFTAVLVTAPVYTLSTGTFDIDGNLTMGNSTNGMSVTANTNDPVIDLEGNVSNTANSTFIASNSAAFNIASSWTNAGTFTHSSGTVTFDSTATGKTLAGTLNGTSAFYKVIFNGVAGAWTIQDPMLVDTSSGTPAADTLVVSNGTVTVGNGNADNLSVYGGIDVATTANQTAVLQTMDGLAEGSTITLQVNKDTATQCANCIVDVGASSGSGQGTLTINENGILKLIPKSSATASDTGVEVASTGKLNVTGALSLAATTSTAITDYDIRETKVCASADFSAGYTSKHVRTTTGLAVGQIYPITATTVNDAQCDTGTHDSITRADTSTASVVSASKTLSNNNGIMAVCIPDSITANDQKIGSYMRDFTGTKGYFQIVDSANDSASCTGTDDLLKVIESPDVFSGFTAGDTIDISDGVRPGDNFEIYDYAHVTAEDGVACTATNDEAGESYIRANAGSETVMNYADVCDLGRNASNKYGVTFNTVNGTNASEGVTIDRSRLWGGYYGTYLNASLNNNTGNSKGITNSSLSTDIYGLYLSSSSNNTLTSNTATGNYYDFYLNTSSNNNTLTSNRATGTVNYGFYLTSSSNNTLTSNSATNTGKGFLLDSNTYNNTLTSNTSTGNTDVGFQLINAYNNTLTSNTATGNVPYGFILVAASNNFLNSNTATGNTAYGFNIYLGSNNNTLSSNTATGNSSYGLFLSDSSNNNTLIGNQSGGQPYGLGNAGTISTGNVVINDVYGASPNTTADITFATGAHTLSLYNTTLSSTTEVTGVTVAASYIISRKNDTTAGATKIWGEYAIPADTAETPQVESTDKFNYANNLWEKSVTAHRYLGTGTEDTNLAYDLSAPADLSAGPYAYKLVTKTAGVGASCVTSQAVMDVYRNGTDVGDLTTGTLFTDSTGSVNTKFTVDCGATPYALNATYTFTAYDADNSTSAQKTMTMMTDGDIFTVGSGKTLEMKGQTTSTNLTTVTRGATGGYHFDIAGTIDAQYYKFSYLGGTSGGNGLDLQSGATLTNLDDGQFDNFQNVGATDTYMKVHGSLIGTGSPAKTWDNMTFLEASDNVPEYSVTQTATGAPAAGNYWVLYPSTCTGWASCEASDSDTGDGGSDPLGFLHWQVNTAPNDPSALAQKKTDDTVLAVGDWTNETSVKFTATASDTDNPDTLYLCVEKKLIADAFTNAEDSCGSGVAYSGSPVTVIVTIAGITDANEYHWQARVKDTIGDYSGWISFGANPEANRDFGVDTTACTYGSSIYDGTVEDVDASYNNGSLTSVSANWDAFTCTVSGLNKYQYSIGTTAGGTDIKGWTDNSTTESVTSGSLVLRTNQNYFFNVRAVDNATNTSGVTSSNGQSVLPTISLSLGATTITFANLNNGNNRSDSKTLVLTSSTNAYGGYVIRQYASSLLTKGIKTIPMFEGGSYASPGAWPGGTCTPSTNCGYGYTSDDTTIQGVNKFSTGTLYAPLSLTSFGDIIADHTTAIDGTSGPVTNEAFTITHKVSVGELQEANPYTTEVLYILTGTF